MIEVYNWYVSHQEEIKQIVWLATQIITMTIGIASIIVKWTPTLRDDNALKSVIRFVGKYIALNR